MRSYWHPTDLEWFRFLRDRFRNGRTYYELERKVADAGGIRRPERSGDRPDQSLLEWHSRERFIA